MSTYKPSGRTVTRTFRVDENWDRVLEEEAERRDISVSALLNQIVHRFVLTGRYYDDGLAVVLPDKTFASIIERVRGDEADELGNNTGLTVPVDRFLMRGITPDYESVIWFIEEVLDKSNGLFSCVYHETREGTFFHLRHDLGENWSRFLGSYMVSTFKSLIGIDVRTELREDTVTVYIDPKAIKQGRK